MPCGRGFLGLSAGRMDERLTPAAGPGPNAGMKPLGNVSAPMRDDGRDIDVARRVLAIEIRGLTALAQGLDRAFVEAVETLARHRGEAIAVCAIG